MILFKRWNCGICVQMWWRMFTGFNIVLIVQVKKLRHIPMFIFPFLFFFFYWKCWINNQLLDSEKNEQNTPGQVKQANTSLGRYTHRQGIVGKMVLGHIIPQMNWLQIPPIPSFIFIRRRIVLNQYQRWHRGSWFNPSSVEWSVVALLKSDSPNLICFFFLWCIFICRMHHCSSDWAGSHSGTSSNISYHCRDWSTDLYK